MPDRMPEGMPDRMSDRMPEGMPDKVPECLPEHMPEDLPDRMPDRMSEDMPEDMPDRIPEDMPDKMPEDMSDRMPQDLPVTKRMDVMVGITRSKVFFLAYPICCSFYSRPLFKNDSWKLSKMMDALSIQNLYIFKIIQNQLQINSSRVPPIR